MEENQDMLTIEREFSKLQTLAIDHHNTNKDTQDAIRGMCNSINSLIQQLEAILSIQLKLSRKTLRKMLKEKPNPKRDYNHSKLKQAKTYQSQREKRDFYMK